MTKTIRATFSGFITAEIKENPELECYNADDGKSIMLKDIENPEDTLGDKYLLSFRNLLNSNASDYELDVFDVEVTEE